MPYRLHHLATIHTSSCFLIMSLCDMDVCPPGKGLRPATLVSYRLLRSWVIFPCCPSRKRCSQHSVCPLQGSVLSRSVLCSLWGSLQIFRMAPGLTQRFKFLISMSTDLTPKSFPQRTPNTLSPWTMKQATCFFHPLSFPMHLLNKERVKG